MAYGMRKPSIKKSFSARTKGRATRALKRSVIPGYGKKGTGFIKNPQRTMYNRVYHRTTFDFTDLFVGLLSIIGTILGLFGVLLLVALIVGCICVVGYLVWMFVSLF